MAQIVLCGIQLIQYTFSNVLIALLVKSPGHRCVDSGSSSRYVFAPYDVELFFECGYRGKNTMASDILDPCTYWAGIWLHVWWDCFVQYPMNRGCKDVRYPPHLNPTRRRELSTLSRQSMKGY